MERDRSEVNSWSKSTNSVGNVNGERTSRESPELRPDDGIFNVGIRYSEKAAP
jgi:hypothetical protein